MGVRWLNGQRCRLTPRRTERCTGRQTDNRSQTYRQTETQQSDDDVSSIIALNIKTSQVKHYLIMLVE